MYGEFAICQNYPRITNFTYSMPVIKTTNILKLHRTIGGFSPTHPGADLGEGEEEVRLHHSYQGFDAIANLRRQSILVLKGSALRITASFGQNFSKCFQNFVKIGSFQCSSSARKN